MLRRKSINLLSAIVIAVFILLSFVKITPFWPVLLVGFIWFLITLCGSFFIQWNYHYPSIHSNKGIQQNHIAITFDDGPHPEFTPKVLSLLQQFNAKATFFCIGQQIEEHPQILQSILNAGHTVGNHTYSHSKSFGFYGTNKVIEELEMTTELVSKLTGKRMRLYRPAFGVTNPSIQKAVKNLNLYSIGWNVRSLDTTPRTVNMILKRITSKVSKGDVVLLHDTSEKTIAVLEQLLLFLEEKQLKSVTVDQLLALNAYV